MKIQVTEYSNKMIWKLRKRVLILQANYYHYFQRKGSQ